MEYEVEGVGLGKYLIFHVSHSVDDGHQLYISKFSYVTVDNTDRSIMIIIVLGMEILGSWLAVQTKS